MTEILIATHNPGKVREYRALLDEMPFVWRLLADLHIHQDIEETGVTFEENARLKAIAYQQLSSLPTLADDSGLEVDALAGAPGVYSARYAGPGASDEDRYRLLLDNLAAVPDGQRQARFVCVTVLALPDGTLTAARGTVEGRILFEPRGENGFGYDPVFWIDEKERTMAQLTSEEKNHVSHRARALADLRPQLVRLLNA